MKKFILIIFILFFNINVNAKEIVTLNKCVDGDTAWFNLNNEKIKARFLAIDTPESTNRIDPYGKEASEFTCNLLKTAKKIEIEYDDNSDKFDKYLITGIGDDFLYPMGQHSVSITSDGKLSIFNNGYNAYKEESVSCKSLKDNASYAVVYNLNLKNKTATIDWKFGGQEYFSYALSSFTAAANGHKVFNSGWHFTEEVNYDDPECTQFSNDKYDAYIIDFDENNNIVNKIKSPESKFEVVKANIYNLESVSVNPKVLKTISNYSTEKGSYIISKDADKYEELSEKEALNYKNSEPQEISFEIHDNKFSLVGHFTKGSYIDIILISPKGKAYKYALKEKDQEMKNYVNLSGLAKGRYYLFTDINGDSYNTGKYIDIE